MSVYAFNSRRELVAYLRNRASEHRARSSQFSARSHRNSEELATAQTYEAIAAMIERSNITVDVAENVGMK